MRASESTGEWRKHRAGEIEWHLAETKKNLGIVCRLQKEIADYDGAKMRKFASSLEDRQRRLEEKIKELEVEAAQCTGSSDIESTGESTGERWRDE